MPSVRNLETVDVTQMPRHIVGANGMWYELVLYVHPDGKPCYRYIPLANVERMFKK